jgi:hypothetical protein
MHRFDRKCCRINLSRGTGVGEDNIKMDYRKILRLRVCTRLK